MPFWPVVRGPLHALPRLRRRALLAACGAGLLATSGCAGAGAVNAALEQAAAAEMARRPDHYGNGEARAFLVRRGGDDRGLLWGTWHVGYDSATALPRAMRRRFSAARLLLVEQVWDEMPAAVRREMATVVVQAQLGSDGAAIAGLGAETVAALAAAGLRGPELERYSLIGLAGLVSEPSSAPVLPGDGVGLLPPGGFVDLALVGFARVLGVAVAGLEEPDPAAVRRLFFAAPNGREAADALRLALRRRGSEEALTGWLRARYLAGEIGRMVAVMTAWQAAPGDLLRADAGRAALLTRRTLAWLPRLERALDEGGPQGVFAAFGAAHLLGRDGIVALLRARGWTVDACVGDVVPGVG